MKIFVVLVAFATVIGSQAAPITPEQKEKLQAYHKDCLGKTGVDEAVVENAKKGNFVEDAKLKNYLLCLSQKIGFQDQNGEIQRDVMKQKLSYVIEDPEVAMKLIEKCAVHKQSPPETAFNTIKCYYENTPNHLYVFNVYVLPDDKAHKLIAYHNECAAKSGVEEKFIQMARKEGKFSEDPKFKDYLLCLSKKFGFQNEAGDIQRDVLKEKLTSVLKDSNLVEKIIEKCAIKKDIPENTAFSTMKCYYETTPIHVRVFPEPQTVTISGEKSQKLRKYHKECLSETGVEEQLLAKARAGEYIEDPKLKEYAFCLSKKFGFQNEAGELQMAVLKEKLSDAIKDPVTAEKLIALCAVQKGSPQDTAFYTMKCYRENTKTHFNILNVPLLTDEQKEKLKRYSRECSEETNVEREIVLKARNGEFTKHPKFKEYLFCISKKSGFQNESGELQRDVSREKLSGVLKDAVMATKLTEKCAITKDSPQNTAFDSFMCYYENSPFHVNDF